MPPAPPSRYEIFSAPPPCHSELVRQLTGHPLTVELLVSERARVVASVGRHEVAVAFEVVFVGRQAFQTDRATGMDLAGRDANLRAKTEPVAVAEAR